MPTIAEYKTHYPNLTPRQVKLMHAARIATQYSTWTGSLTHTRTIALSPLIVRVEPSAEQLSIANALLSSKLSKSYAPDALNYPRMNADAGLLSQTIAPKVPIEGVELQDPDWTVCKKVGFHSDDVNADETAYAFWCVKSTAPMTLILGGNAYPMKDGQLVIVDARVPHALLSADPDAAMSAIISTTPLTADLRERMGIFSRRAGSVALEKLTLMDRLEIDNETGTFALPGLGP